MEFAQTDTEMTSVYTSIHTLHARNSDKNIYIQSESNESKNEKKRKKNLHLTSAKKKKENRLYTLQ